MDSTHSPQVDPGALTRATSDALSVRRVFGEAYERDGAQVIPVAKVLGGTGAGYGSGSLADDGAAEHDGEGGGGGFGVRVRPVGVYVVDESGVHWHPALDLNRVILGGQAVGAIAVLALAWGLRRRSR